MKNIKLGKIDIPELKETKSYKGGYYMAGKDNKWFDELVRLYEQSSIHNSFINNFTQKVIGTGIQSDNETDNKVIKEKELNDLYGKITLDYSIYGGFAIEVIWNVLHTNILELNYIDFSKVRSGYVDQDTDKVEFYHYSHDWSAYHKNTTLYQSFNEEGGTENRQLFYFKGHHPSSDIYPRPMYLGGLKYIYTDIQLATFYANLVKNNFVGNTILKVPLGMDPDNQIAFEKGIKDNFTNPENAGSIVVVYGDGENVVDLVEFGKGSDDAKYQWLTQHVIDELVISHRIPNPIIAGVRVPGSLGGTTEMAEAENIYNKNVIYPSRLTILNEMEKLNSYFITPLEEVSVEDITLFDTTIENKQ